MEPTSDVSREAAPLRLATNVSTTEPVWERPRRPLDPEPTRWRNAMPIVVLAMIGLGAWFAFAERSDGEDRREPASSNATNSSAVDTDREIGFSLVSASWGHVVEPETSRTVRPPEPTQSEVREKAFHAAAAERWKGVEIFVRRDR